MLLEFFLIGINLAFRLFCDWRKLTRLKRKLYKTSIRPTKAHGKECWPIKKQHMYRMGVTEMRTLRWMCVKTRKDIIRNVDFGEHLEVASTSDKIINSFEMVWTSPMQANN